jgi:hypothetical protein
MDQLVPIVPLARLKLSITPVDGKLEEWVTTFDKVLGPETATIFGFPEAGSVGE